MKDIMLDNAETNHFDVEVEKSRQDLYKLAATYAATLEEERKHIAREVHDELGQILTALRMNVSLVRIQFGDGNPPLMERIQGITNLIDRAIQGVRNVTSSLRPPVLDKGIIPAIRWLCAEYTRHSATPCTLEIDSEDIELDEMRAVMIFRIVQESLTNIVRHAEADSARIFIRRQEDRLVVEVHDSGKGFDPLAQACKGTFGLLGMRERAIALGGNLDIVSAESRGTAVSVCIPISPNRVTS